MESSEATTETAATEEAQAAQPVQEVQRINVIGRGSVAWSPVSQTQFQANPFQNSKWSVVKGDSQPQGFQRIHLEVVETPPNDPMFQNFDGSSPASAKWAGSPSAAAASSPQLQEGDMILTKAEFDQRKKEFYKSGYKAGLAEVNKKADEHAALLKTRLEELHTQVQAQLQAFFSKVEKRSVELSVSVARRILDATRDARPEYIHEVIKQAVSALGAAKPIRIRLSQDDFEFVKVVGVPAEISAGELGIEYVADEAIRSGCVIETDFGNVDAQLESMWQQVASRLYEVTK